MCLVAPTIASKGEVQWGPVSGWVTGIGSSLEVRDIRCGYKSVIRSNSSMTLNTSTLCSVAARLLAVLTERPSRTRQCAPLCQSQLGPVPTEEARSTTSSSSARAC
jgi:hypothetical protein